jgi:hypothetical protein
MPDKTPERRVIQISIGSTRNRVAGSANLANLPRGKE